MTITFEAWKSQVNRKVEGRVGLGLDDLPDCPFYDWFDDGVDPGEAAELTLEEVGFGA